MPDINAALNRTVSVWKEAVVSGGSMEGTAVFSGMNIAELLNVQQIVEREMGLMSGADAFAYLEALETRLKTVSYENRDFNPSNFGRSVRGEVTDPSMAVPVQEFFTWLTEMKGTINRGKRSGDRHDPPTWDLHFGCTSRIPATAASPS